MKKIFNIVLFLSTIMFASCSNNEIISDDEQQEQGTVEELFEQNEYNLDLRDFALAVRNAMDTSEEFRKLIKREALSKFDGDYDVLLSHIMDKSIVPNEGAQLRSNDNYTVKDLLEDSYSSNSGSSTATLRASSASIVSSLSAKYPNLQVSIPVNAENWDETSATTVVTFIPSEFQDGVTQSVTGYDSEGRLTVIDATKLPKETVIVISENERVVLWNPLGPLRPCTPFYPIPPDGPQPPTALQEIPDNTVPPAPTNLTASQTASGVALNWKETTETFMCHTIGYYIYKKSPSDENYILRGVNNGINNTTYYDVSTESGKTYSYYVAAYNSKGESARSNVISVVGTGRPASLLSFEAIQNNSKEVELRWATDNNQYIQKIQLYKHILGTTTDYQLYKEFGANDYHYMDNQLTAGKTMKYKLQIATPTGTSNAKYDFIQVPYRDPSKPSPVKIKHISCSEDVESWLRGSPEFCIKVLSVSTKDRTKSTEVQSEIYCPFSGNLFTSIGMKVWKQNFDNLVLNWKPDLWYDVLTFYVIEDDKNKTWDTNFNAKSYYKKELASGLGVDSTIDAKYSFSHTGETIGYQYVDYFAPTTQTLDFPNYGFTMRIE